MELENNVDQTSGESNGGNNQPDTTYKVNWQDMSGDNLLESYNNLQKEFTTKSQKLSEYEKQGNNADEVKQKAEQAEKADKVRAEEEVFNTFKSDYPTLSEYQLKTIRDLQTVDTSKSFDDIAKSYGMLDEAQIERSRGNRAVMWNNIWVKSNQAPEVIITEAARRAHNLQSQEKLAEIKNTFGL